MYKCVIYLWSCLSSAVLCTLPSALTLALSLLVLVAVHLEGRVHVEARSQGCYSTYILKNTAVGAHLHVRGYDDTEYSLFGNEA